MIALPSVMTYIVLRYSDPVAMRWGPWALALGPAVYVLVKLFGKSTEPAIRQPKNYD